jgi:hypothetical protein
MIEYSNFIIILTFIFFLGVSILAYLMTHNEGIFIYIEFSPLLEYHEELDLSKMKKERKAPTIINRESILSQWGFN